MLSAADLLETLRRLNLLADAELATLTRECQGRALQAGDFARALVERRWLTAYQANRLLQDRGRELLLGSYVLLEKLGEGGMGTVYKARQRGLGRVVAVKVIRKDRLANEQAVKRFQREIRAAAALDHPNIVHALDADEIDGSHILVMEYVENGCDLFRWVTKERGPLPVDEACEYIRQAALGLQHAHERGLVHRDIKPQNLLLQIADGRLPIDQSTIGNRQSAIIKILDLGLARLSEAEAAGESITTLTHEGVVMGTLDYMAPEQAMDSHHADTRADLYSLGCTFYFLLTGRAPFPGGDVMSKLLKHRMDEPAPIQKYRADVPDAVVAIVRKLMAKRPEDRYQTPAQLVQALEGRTHSQGVRTAAAVRRDSSATSIESPFGDLWSSTTTLPKPAKEKRKREAIPPALLLAGGGLAVLLLVGAVVVGVGAFRGSARKNADTGRSTKVTQLPPVQPRPEVLERERLQAAEQALRPLAERAAALAPGAGEAGEALRKDLREFLMKHSATPAATRACELLGQVLAKLPSPLDELDPKRIPEDAQASWNTSGFEGTDVVAVLGDHRWRTIGSGYGPFLTVPSSNLVACARGGINLIDTTTGQLKALIREPAVSRIAVSPDGKTLASTAAKDKTIKLWDTASGRLRGALTGHGDEAWDVAFTPDGKTLASSSKDGTIVVWDLETKKERLRIKGFVDWGPPLPLAISPDGKLLAIWHSGGDPSNIQLWDLDTLQPRAVPNFTCGRLMTLAFPPLRETLLVGDINGVVHVWNWKTNKVERTLNMEWGGNPHLALSPKGNFLAVGGGDWKRIGSPGPVKLWELPSFKERGTFSVPDQVYGLCFSQDGQTLFIGCGDAPGIMRFDMASGKQLKPPTEFVGHAVTVAFNPELNTVASGHSDGTLKLWQFSASTSRLLTSWKGHQGVINFVAYAPDGRTMASASDDKTVKLWDMAMSPPVERTTLAENDGRMVNVVFSPPGKLLAGADYVTGKIRLWEIGLSGVKSHAVVEAQHGVIHSLAFSPDGQTLVSTGGDRSVRLWDVTAPSPRLKKTLRGIAPLADFSWSESPTVSPDGYRIAACGRDRTVRVWDLGEDATKGDLVLEGHTNAVVWVAFSPDGTSLASNDGSGTLILWDALKGTVRRKWNLPGIASRIAFAPDGRHLATANGNGTVYFFRLADGPPRALSASEAKQKQENEAKRLGVPVQITSGIGMKLNLIPPGKFLMGSPDNEPGRDADEGPQREITVSRPFAMGIHEITVGQFKAFVEATGHVTEAEKSGEGSARLDLEAQKWIINDPKVTWRTPGWEQTDAHPVTCVSWNDAVAFCAWLSKKEVRTYRLPTEAEWEYACRGGTRTPFHSGASLAIEQANCTGDGAVYTKGKGPDKTVPVGSYAPNPFGLYDMHGNVWEWCMDWYAADAYATAAAVNPTGPATGTKRVNRGGGWHSPAVHCRAAYREKSLTPSSRGHNTGFRVVLEPE